MVHNKNIKTYAAISIHLEMEQERLKSFTSSNVALVAQGSGTRDNRPFIGKKPKRGPCPTQNSRSKGLIAKRKKAKGNGEKNMACVEYYNCGKNGHYARDCPEPAKDVFLLKLPLFVYFHTFIANSLPQ